MRDQGGELHSETDEARAGSTPHVVRWVLGISLAAAIILLSAIWMIGAASQDDVEDEVTATGKIQDREDESRSDIDGVVSQDADRFAPETPADATAAPGTDTVRTIEN